LESSKSSVILKTVESSPLAAFEIKNKETGITKELEFDIRYWTGAAHSYNGQKSGVYIF
jgi:hypothetical protein